MATPRADSTLAQRVKKLEQDFRRIKLSPSVIQSAAEPQAAAKGSLWLDASAGNEPKVFDGTGWVPARDETIAVAQSTADTAQATVDPLVPLTDLATVTTGTTITGGTQTTAASGPRIGLNDPAYPNQIVFYTDNPAETVPSGLQPQGAGGAILRMRGPGVTGVPAPATFQLGANDVDGTCTADLDADIIRASGADVTIEGFNSLRLGDSTDYITIVGRVVTNADLSSLTNTFPTFPYYSCYLAANATINTGTATGISWTDDATSPSSGITRSGSAFTVPTAGRYRITFQAYWAAIASPAGSRVAQVYTGNVIGAGTPLISVAEPPSATSASICLAVKTIRLAAGAVIHTEVSHTQGATMTNGLLGNATGNLTYAQIEWVGP